MTITQRQAIRSLAVISFFGLLVPCAIFFGPLLWFEMNKMDAERAASYQVPKAIEEKKPEFFHGQSLPTEVEILEVAGHPEGNRVSPTYRRVIVKGEQPAPFLAEIYLRLPPNRDVSIDDMRGQEILVPRPRDKALFDWNEQKKRYMLLRPESKQLTEKKEDPEQRAWSRGY